MTLNRFVTAQDAVHTAMLAELRAGRKRTHWMWFVFPQLAGLGTSPTARFHALADAAEARAFLAHPVLAQRLFEATATMLAAPGSAVEILGETDAVKLRSSMTLLAAVADDPTPFAAVLARFYGGGSDPATLRLLG
ncbi:DUF1810 domain-containing protein [uncultured Sphingomonas sp.]|uniref:DUF1810 domain-containing protein n=1 Tax=uncultured Sphingomonas sp. TaxID=158754 RepID=UPI0035CC1E08